MPRSTTTIWKILKSNHRILVDRHRKPKPLEQRDPMQEIQIDFKDDSTVPAAPLGKRQHVVETCNFVDAGTSIWLHGAVREDFTAETAFEAVVEFLQLYGLPSMLTFDRDPTLGGQCQRTRFSVSFCALLALPGHPAYYLPATSTRQELLRRTTPSPLQVRVLASTSPWDSSPSA